MKENKYKYVVEKLIELSCKGVEITLSEHMGETVIEWKDKHAHVSFFNGEKGTLDSIISILNEIEGTTKINNQED